MARSLITKWEDLSTAHHEGDRLSILVRDMTGKMKFLDCHIYGVYREGDAEYEEEQDKHWPTAMREKGDDVKR